MGLREFARSIFQRQAVPLSQANQLSAPGWFGVPTSSGLRIGTVDPLTLSSWYACVRLISNSLAAMPLDTMEQTSRGWVKALQYPLYPLLHDAPNDDQTSFTFRQTYWFHVLNWGNGYALIDRDSLTFEVRGLYTLAPDRVRVLRNANNLLVYEVRLFDGSFEVLSPDRIFHVHGMSYDGLLGIEPIATNRETVGTALAADQHAGRYFTGQVGNRYLKTSSVLGDDAYKRVKADLEANYGGLVNAYRIPILESGLEFGELGLSPEATQLLESRRFNSTQIAQLFGVPLYKLGIEGSSQTYINGEQANSQFYTDCLLPWITAFEQECHRKLLIGDEKRTYCVKHDIDHLLRADMKTRYECYRIANPGGAWLTDNDILEKEGMLSYEGGDLHLKPLNMKPVEAYEADEEAAETPEEEQEEAAGQEPIDQEETAAAEQEEGESQSARAVDALAPVIEAAIGRLAVKEFEAFGRARKRHQDQQTLTAWADGFMAEHRSLVESSLEPTFASAAALTGHRRGVGPDLLDRYISGARSSLASATDLDSFISSRKAAITAEVLAILRERN